MKKQQEVLAKVEPHLRRDSDPTDLMEWEQEVYALNDGEYRAVGRLRLPFKAEDVQDDDPESPIRVYTCFIDEFFETGKIHTKEWGVVDNSTDFYDKHPKETLVVYQHSFLQGIRELIGDYFDMRKKMQDEKPSRAKELVMGCFAEYEK